MDGVGKGALPGLSSGWLGCWLYCIELKEEWPLWLLLSKVVAEVSSDKFAILAWKHALRNSTIARGEGGGGQVATWVGVARQVLLTVGGSMEISEMLHTLCQYDAVVVNQCCQLLCLQPTHGHSHLDAMTKATRHQASVLSAS